MCKANENSNIFTIWRFLDDFVNKTARCKWSIRRFSIFENLIIFDNFVATFAKKKLLCTLKIPGNQQLYMTRSEDFLTRKWKILGAGHVQLLIMPKTVWFESRYFWIWDRNNFHLRYYRALYFISRWNYWRNRGFVTQRFPRRHLSFRFLPIFDVRPDIAPLLVLFNGM